MRRILLLFLVCLFHIFSFAQSIDDALDEMIAVTSTCIELQSRARKAYHQGHVDESIVCINVALNSLKAHSIGGLMPCLMMADLIHYQYYKEDWYNAVSNAMLLRNRALDQVLKDINNSFAYGLFDAMDDSYISEGLLCVQLYHNAISNMAWKLPNETTNQLAIESLLHTKSLRLKADNNFQFLAYETNDMQADSLLDLLATTRDSLQNWRSMHSKLSFAERQKTWNPEIMGWDEEKRFEEKIKQIKSEIVSCYQSHPEFSQHFFCSWREVQAKLQKDEIAIEFVRIPDWDSDSIHYAALCFKAESDYPNVYRLFDEKDLEGQDLVHNADHLYSLIWKPLAGELHEVRNIYFSLDGKLQTIAVEALKNEQGDTMTDKFGLYRLSSARELLKSAKSISCQEAILYGGLKYTASEETLLATRDGHGKTRGGLDEITAETLQEVMDIGRILKERGVKYEIFTGLNGTEESFKALSGSPITLLHLSTHGFYSPEKTVISKKNATSEDSIMSASGLLMSGARLAWEGKKVPKGLDDGILTSEEIAKLRFSSLDLVVLSACETGLGNISGTEGVFGLQRGFKKAGAKSILMTLWEVDDVATRLFMVEFYKHYLAGKSKMAALRAAQNFLRNYRDENNKRCYDSPEYWAAFVLLDAI